MNPFERDLDCSRCAEAAAFVLGALGHEERGYREHLLSCAICQAEVAELRVVIDAVPSSAPPVVASDALRERVMAIVRSEAELLKAAGPSADLVPRRRRRWGARAGPLLAVGTLLAAVLISALIVNAPGPVVRTTPALIGSSLSGAHAVLREVGDRGDLVVSGMPPPPLDKTYEVWVQRARGAPMPTDALFTVTRRGSASVDVPGSLNGVREVLVSAEPLGGSSHLTGPPLLRVSIS